MKNGPYSKVDIALNIIYFIVDSRRFAIPYSYYTGESLKSRYCSPKHVDNRYDTFRKAFCM